MINKFQTGGKQTSQGNDAIVKFVQALAGVLKTDPQKVIQIAQQNPEALEAAVQVYQKSQNIEQAAQAFSQAVQQQTIAARHGAKLNYLKSLKNQCPEGQEPYYYKKGGMVKCGCSGKKLQDGGEVKKESAVTKFKKQRSEGTFGRAIGKVAKVATNSAKKAIDKAKEEHRKELEWKVSGKNTSTSSDYAEYDKCGSKIKKHNNGGSLNGIPFYQKGTNENGVQYKFRRTTNNMNNGYKTYSDQIMMTRDPEGYSTYDLPPISAGRTIYVTPQGNDTIFYTNNPDVFNLTPKKDLNQRRAKQKFYQLIKKAPIEGEEYRNTQYWNSNHINQDAVRNRALMGN